MGYLVVGVDGTDASRDALLWAIHAARRFELDVRVVHCYVAETAGLLGPGSLYGATLRTAEPPPGDEGDPVLQAQRQLERLVRDVLGGEPDVPLEVIVVDEGRPGKVLLAQAEHADLLVVGTRGRGGLTNLLLGSTSQRLAQESACPVVIIRTGKR
jgi:nucleotide-binding universal stress UspA family protein